MENNEQKVSVNLNDAEAIVCNECENKTFSRVVMLKKLSALLSPTGEELIFPIEVFECANCGQLYIPDEAKHLVN